MCGIVGYVGTKSSKSFIMQGLSRLEYRGYDSAGYACIDANNQLSCVKVQGGLENLRARMAGNSLDGAVGLGHIRWATHGKSSELNAHPHVDCEHKIAIVHNGIIENYLALSNQIAGGNHIRTSETDTEIIAHLFEDLLKTHATFESAVIDLVNQLHGAFAIACMVQDVPDSLLVIRKSSPLCVGIGEDEMFIASDPFAFADKTNKVLFLPDESYAFVQRGMIKLYDFSGKPLPLNVQTVAIDWDNLDKKGHEHFMLKEIYEQKNAIHATVHALHSQQSPLLDQLGLDAQLIKEVEHVVLIGCGASWFAALIAKFYFETVCNMATTVYLSSEFRYQQFFAHKNAIYIFISQSGETADTLEAMRLVNSLHLPTIALTNVATSTMAREARGFFVTKAGFEVAVATTKSFASQLAALYWFAHYVAQQKGIIGAQELNVAYDDLLVTAQLLEATVEKYRAEIMHNHALQYVKHKKAICLGRHISFPFALEAALKFKEIAYVFTQCYPAGELKHGPLALVEAGLPVFIFSHLDPIIYQKLLSNVQEVKARGGHIVAFVFEGQTELRALADVAFMLPTVKPLLGPLVMTGLTHFFVYCLARQLGNPIDKPRNLAKSVTVE